MVFKVNSRMLSPDDPHMQPRRESSRAAWPSLGALWRRDHLATRAHSTKEVLADSDARLAKPRPSRPPPCAVTALAPKEMGGLQVRNPQSLKPALDPCLGQGKRCGPTDIRKAGAAQPASSWMRFMTHTRRMDSRAQHQGRPWKTRGPLPATGSSMCLARAKDWSGRQQG